MATIITHTAVAITAGTVYAKNKMPRYFWTLSIICSILPDIDILGFGFGIKYADFLGHRGFTHSLTFAALVGFIVTFVFFKNIPRFSKKWWGLLIYFFLLTASHGVLDAMTNGGLGIAFFAPFDNQRYFLPWRPLLVSPIGINHFLTKYGLDVLLTEIRWIWGPLFIVLGMTFMLRKPKKLQ